MGVGVDDDDDVGDFVLGWVSLAEDFAVDEDLNEDELLFRR